MMNRSLKAVVLGLFVASAGVAVANPYMETFKFGVLRSLQNPVMSFNKIAEGLFLLAASGIGYKAVTAFVQMMKHELEQRKFDFERRKQHIAVHDATCPKHKAAVAAHAAAQK